VARGGRLDLRARSRLRVVGEAILDPPSDDGSGRPAVSLRFVPSGRSVLLTIAVLLVAGLSYLLAHETSLFAVRQIEIRGASPAVKREVRSVLRATGGQSLVGLNLERLQGLVQDIPSVHAVAFDRAFPHTLVAVIRPERPVAVVRQGHSGYLVSRRARVIAAVPRGSHPRLARIWVPTAAALSLGETAPERIRPAVRAVTPLAGRRFPSRVASVTSSRGELTLRLASGVEVRIGKPADVELKLAIAARVLPLLADGYTYLDVSVPGRPVAGTPATDAPRPSLDPAPASSPPGSATILEQVTADPVEPTQPISEDKAQVEVDVHSSTNPQVLR
jgi:cell division protein FtsQ